MVIRPGVAAVIRDDESRVLLHERRVGGGWAPPSGGLEPGEDVRSGLLREIREETNLDVAIQRLIGVYSDPAFMVISYPDGRRIHYVTCLFACQKTGGELRGSEEGTAWGWFTRDRLPAELASYAKIWLQDAFDGKEVMVR